MGELYTPPGTEVASKGIDTSKAKPVKKKKIKKLPKIKDIKIVSIDVGSKYIKIIEAKKNRNTINVTNAVKIESPREVIENGEIRNLPSIITMLRDTFLKRHISTKDVSFTGAAESIISREIVIIDNDEISEKERNILVQNELRQYLPINLDDYQIQFTDAGRFEEAGVKKIKILVMVYPIALIKRYLSVVKEVSSKLRPCSLDVTNNSVQKLFRHVKKINDKPVDKSKVHLIIDMGALTFNASIISDGKLEFMRTIPAGSAEIDKKIAFKIGMSIEDAEIEKIEKCNLMVDELSDEDKEVNVLIKLVLNGWFDEVERIMQFYSNKEQKRIEKIYIYGGASRLVGLPEYMQERLNIETEKINSFDGVELSKGVNIAHIDQFINTLGTIIRF